MEVENLLLVEESTVAFQGTILHFHVSESEGMLSY